MAQRKRPGDIGEIMSELRKHLIRLANKKPELRAKIVPILKQGSADWSGASTYMKSLRGSMKVLGGHITKKDERKTVLESKLALKWISSILTAIGKDSEANAVNQAAQKLR